MNLNLILSHLGGSALIGKFFLDVRIPSLKPTLDVSTPPFLKPPNPWNMVKLVCIHHQAATKNGGRLDFQGNTWNLNSTFLSFYEVLLPAVRQDIGELGSPSDGTIQLRWVPLIWGWRNYDWYCWWFRNPTITTWDVFPTVWIMR